jgi:hypothetical protein
VLACGLAAFACGNTGTGGLGGTGGGATATDLQQLCASRCARNERCGSPDPSCQNNCANDIQHPGNIRKDFIDAYASCLDQLACDLSDDSCLEQAVNAVNPNWQQDALFNECTTRRAACQSFTDDICAAALYFTDAARERLRECLNLDCAAISACLDDLA